MTLDPLVVADICRSRWPSLSAWFILVRAASGEVAPGRSSEGISSGSYLDAETHDIYGSRRESG